MTEHREVNISRLTEMGLSPDFLGERVREAWVRWARRQENPKPHWLVPWSELGESDRDADREIGGAVALIAIAHAELRAQAIEEAKGVLESFEREHITMGGATVDANRVADMLLAVHGLLARRSPADGGGLERLECDSEDETHYWPARAAGTVEKPGTPCNCGQRVWPDPESERLLGDLVFQTQQNHSLPWKIISGWTEEVVASDGTVVFKADTREEAQRIIGIAEEFDRGLTKYVAEETRAADADLAAGEKESTTPAPTPTGSADNHLNGNDQ